MVTLTVNGRKTEALTSATILDAARQNGITIPTLCHYKGLSPYGACRLCVVEIETPAGLKQVASCSYPVEDNLVVQTRSGKVDRIRKTLLELLMAHAPDSPQLEELAVEYGADRNRFEKEASFCIHCGLCVRYCDEVKKLNAVGFVDRGIRKEISFIPELAAKECWNCKECFELCPTEALQAAYVLAESLFSLTPSLKPESKE